VPNIEGMNIEAAGIKVKKGEGFDVDYRLRTTNDNVYAVGDCVSKVNFTHNSDVHARYVVRNALFEENKDRRDIIIPWCTYTEPEIAHVGKYPR
jgi:pyruvate/2-oxoglutarate dehydrogenase complex dihydrolipoamide dehydrogenase (E3) component